MRPPEIDGRIERRLLVNYRVDPDVIAQLLPVPFRPQLVNDAGVAGICLIRLGSMRPHGFPKWVGLNSENAAHRIAVEWDGLAGPQTGVYIPRRDSSSWVNTAVGGRIYPGRHFKARFEVNETDEELSVAYAALAGSARVDVSVQPADQLCGSSLFADLAEASAFFEAGSVGYSGTREPQRFDGLALKTSAWRVEATVVNHSHSSFFDDLATFPAGSAELDSALVMRGVPVSWEPLATLRSDKDGTRVP
jgi:hypothetical protein